MPEKETTWSRRKVLGAGSGLGAGAIVLMVAEAVKDWFRERDEAARDEELLGAWQQLFEREATARMEAEKQLTECRSNP